MTTLAAHDGAPAARGWRVAAPLYLAGAAAAAPTVSIAAYQILLGAALLALLVGVLTPEGRRRWRWPPAAIPLAAFLGWTLLALAASPDPRAGLPQIKKFYVFTMLIVVFSGLRSLRHVSWVALGWISGATLSALWALGQGVRMYLATPQFFYYVYSNQGRITGFMDHWMTFSGITMMALLIGGSWLLFGPGELRSTGGQPAEGTRKGWKTVALLASLAVLALALLVGYQRTMWAGTAVGAMWLLGSRNRWLVFAVPLLAALLLALNPFHVRDRALSVIRPQPGVLDSGAHRAALRATGWEMIRAHPWLGVGPEQVSPRFLDYAPPSVPRPLPGEWSIGHLHNIYYQYAAERGLPALAFLLWFLGRILWDLAAALRMTCGRTAELAGARWMLQAALAVTIAIMVAGYWEVNLGDSEVLGMFLAVAACGYVAREQVLHRAVARS